MLLLNKDTSGLDGSLLGIESLLLSDPDDLYLHRTYANLLLRHPVQAFANRGRFIETQLKLEESKQGSEETPKLERRVRKFLKNHGEVWLGELAPYLLDNKGLARRQNYRYTLVRGWLDSIVAPILDVQFLRILAQASQVRLLRSLIFESVSPEVTSADLAILFEAPFLTQLRVFQIDPKAHWLSEQILSDLVQQMNKVQDVCSPWHPRVAN